MTAPEQIVDPQLTAFWAKDPNQLKAPDYVNLPEQESEPQHTSRARLALELAAAWLVCSRLARAALSKRRGGDPDEAGKQAWGGVVGVFTGLSTDALVRALRSDPTVAALSPREAQQLASTYIEGMTSYLRESTLKAFTFAYERQLAQKWSEQVAFVRASAAFGIDQQAMGPYLTKAAAVVSQEIVTPAAQAIADAALMVRAELIGDTESRTAVQSAKTMRWLSMQAAGELSAAAKRRWVTARFEDDCAICGALDRQEVDLAAPFVVDGFEIWNPQAHPNCKCHVELVPHGDVTKRYNPNERRGQPGNKGQWAAAPVAEAEKLADPLAGLSVAEEPVETLFTAPAQQALFTESLFTSRAGQAAALGDLFTKPTPALFTGQALDLQGEGLKLSRPSGPPPIRRVITRRIMVPPPPEPPSRFPYFMPVADFNDEVDEDFDATYTAGDDVDFDQAHEKPVKFPLVAMSATSPFVALTYEHLAQGRVQTRNARDENNEVIWNDDGTPMQTPKVKFPEVRTMWSNLMPDAVRGWHAAMREAVDPDDPKRGIINELEPKDRAYIADMAGFTGFKGDKDLRGKIALAVEKQHRGDTSLADAYADYVTFQAPWLLGELGTEIDAHLELFREDGVDLHDRPYDQVLTFGFGFHPGTRKNKAEADPRGRFYALGTTYRSAIRHYGRSAPPLQMGVQELHIQPAAVHRRPFLGPGS